MQDPFEILELSRAYCVDSEQLSMIFNDLSKKYHPDVSGGGRTKFEAVNAAHRTLSVTSSRLKSLRFLVFPDSEPARGGSMDPELMDLFSKMGPAVQQADEVAKQHAEAKSALAKALVADAVWEARDQLEQIGMEIAEGLAGVESDLSEMGEPGSGGADELGQLDRCYHTAAFLEKWQAQVREKLTALMGAI